MSSVNTLQTQLILSPPRQTPSQLRQIMTFEMSSFQSVNLVVCLVCGYKTDSCHRHVHQHPPAFHFTLYILSFFLSLFQVFFYFQVLSVRFSVKQIKFFFFNLSPCHMSLFITYPLFIHLKQFQKEADLLKLIKQLAVGAT